MKAIIWVVYPIVFWGFLYAHLATNGNGQNSANTPAQLRDTIEQVAAPLKLKGSISFYAAGHEALKPLKMSDQPVAAYFAIAVQDFKAEGGSTYNSIEYENCRFTLKAYNHEQIDFVLWGDGERVKAVYDLLRKVNLKVDLEAISAYP